MKIDINTGMNEETDMEVAYIIDMFGEPDEEIDDDDLDNITDEIQSLDPHESFILSTKAIYLGKPQILEYLVKNNNFSIKQISLLQEYVENYVNNKDDDDLDVNIVKKFEQIINNSKKWKPHVKKN